MINFAEKNHIYRYKVHDNTNEYIKTVFGITKPKKTTIPYKIFNNNKRENTKISSEFANLLDESYGGINALNFLVHEIINNMHDHSYFNKGQTFAQYYPNQNLADICFMDDGISIPGRFEECGFEFDNDCNAIYQAINGKSSDILKQNIRGTGLNISINLVKNGIEGSILIASRKGLCYINNKIIYKEIEDIKGTLVSLRIKQKVVNIYDYMLPIRI